MAILNLNRIPSSKFYWNKNNKTFSQECSSLKGFNVLSRIYDDACDEGFILVGEKTGKEVIFYLEKTEYHDGELCSWNFKVVKNKASRELNMLETKLVIFND